MASSVCLKTYQNELARVFFCSFYTDIRNLDFLNLKLEMLGISTLKSSLIGVKVDISIGEGNGTPLQYSCLENPMDGGA